MTKIAVQGGWRCRNLEIIINLLTVFYSNPENCYNPDINKICGAEILGEIDRAWILLWEIYNKTFCTNILKRTLQIRIFIEDKVDRINW